MARLEIPDWTGGHRLTVAAFTNFGESVVAAFQKQGFETVVLCKEMGHGPAAYAGYMLHMLKQMRCMATSSSSCSVFV